MDVRVDANTDDVEQSTVDGEMYDTSSDLELGNDPDYFGEQTVGIRFTGVNIPFDATIVDAYITFVAKSDDSDATSVEVAAQLDDDAPAFTTTPYDLTSRPTTSATVAWANMGAWSTGDVVDTPNLAAVVEELVGQAGWVAGNSMVFVISGTGCRTALSHDGNAAQAPLLHVEWTLP